MRTNNRHLLEKAIKPSNDMHFSLSLWYNYSALKGDLFEGYFMNVGCVVLEYRTLEKVWFAIILLLKVFETRKFSWFPSTQENILTTN